MTRFVGAGHARDCIGKCLFRLYSFAGMARSYGLAVGRNKPVLSEAERPAPAGVSGMMTGTAIKLSRHTGMDAGIQIAWMPPSLAVHGA